MTIRVLYRFTNTTEVTLARGYRLPALCYRRDDHVHHRAGRDDHRRRRRRKGDDDFRRPGGRDPRARTAARMDATATPSPAPTDLPVAGFPLMLRVAVPVLLSDP